MQMSGAAQYSTAQIFFAVSRWAETASLPACLPVLSLTFDRGSLVGRMWIAANTCGFESAVSAVPY